METTNQFLTEELKKLKRTIVVRLVIVLGVLTALVLIPAGTFYFWQLYIYLAIIVVPMIFVMTYFLKTNPRFLEYRMRVKEKETSQKRVQVIYLIFFLAGYIISGLDKRCGWSDLPLSIVIMADLVVLLSYIFIFFVFKENSYASRIVEVNKDQIVISTGPYKVVRHPMYLGVIIMYCITPIALGSIWGIFPYLVIPLALVLRIRNEEEFLSRELPGYTDYCLKVKYRLIPYVW